MSNIIRLNLYFFFIYALIFVSACTRYSRIDTETQSLSSDPEGEVIIFHADSLTVSFEEMEKEFETKHPQIDIKREAGGSTRMARMIAELGEPADIMASADYTVIDKRLIPGKASWNVRFAKNQLVLCYTDKSKYAKKINSDNWYKILGLKGVKWGHSDPNLDPGGYRSLMAIKLAEIYYKSPGLYEKLIDNRPKTNVRSNSVELVSLLQTGQLDYAWEYLSSAVQYRLKHVKLPDNINLGNYKFDNFYKQAIVEVTGKKPGTTIKRMGKSITYGVTLIKDAPNRSAAITFMQYMLSPDGGLKILKEMGQPPFIPCRVPTEEMKNKLPGSIKGFAEVKQ